MGQCEYRFFLTVIPFLLTDIARHYSMSLTHAAESDVQQLRLNLLPSKNINEGLWDNASTGFFLQ